MGNASCGRLRSRLGPLPPTIKGKVHQGGYGWLCAYCGDVLGVYEPIAVIINNQIVGIMSLASARELPVDRVVLVHKECAGELLGRDRF